MSRNSPTRVHPYARVDAPSASTSTFPATASSSFATTCVSAAATGMVTTYGASSSSSKTQLTPFQEEILRGIPQDDLPSKAGAPDPTISHAPKRKEILNNRDKQLALKNALRYFAPKFHAELAPEFAAELQEYGRIYMYRFRPTYAMHARPISEYPGKSMQARGIMLMIQNNLDPRVAQHPHELITYGGNGAVFQNWAQYLLTMQYLAQMTDTQTLAMYSGHPHGLFPSSTEAPRVVVTNGMVIPNYSKPDDYERMNAMGVSQYGQMTAGSYMYIGPQGIVHGTTITLLNASRLLAKKRGTEKQNASGKPCPLLFVTAGLGGMSGAQPKAGNIAGVVSITAEIDTIAAKKRHHQGWVDEIQTDLPTLLRKVRKAQDVDRQARSFAYIGNIVELWEFLVKEKVQVDLGSDQSSLHIPFSGGYYPADIPLAESRRLLREEPDRFKSLVEATLRRHAAAVNLMTTERGMYFFDYGNAFLLQCGRAGADIFDKADPTRYRYASYVEDIMGPICFDFGFGPFRWVCCSGDPADLQRTDEIACQVLEQVAKESPPEIQQQLRDNITWIKGARANKLVVGSQARILYADAEGRSRIAAEFNRQIASGDLKAPVVLGRDHHDVSGTDSPYRETSNIYDGSSFCADMAVQNFCGDAFRGATWVSLHNGGGVGWGEVVNGGFGMLLDGSPAADTRLKRMLHWDVYNGITRRSWARNPNAKFAINREMAANPEFRVTTPHEVQDSKLLKSLFPDANL
ncbi:unnamed protein product [Amoebophrya sp. A25]|nr:unnamed protein product [Amoebophrya sp. A25]|eukprot:GSA25T00007842001.1